MTDRTIQASQDPGYLAEISEYLNALASPTRLKILTALENRPMDLKEITVVTKTSYENSRKHMDKLLLAGLVRKEAGLSSETMTGIHPVWKYSIARGGMEAIITNLSMFSKVPLSVSRSELADRIRDVKTRVGEETGTRGACLYLASGVQEGTIIPLDTGTTSIGRADPGATRPHDPCFELSPEYKSVSRVSRPHCRLHRGTCWEIEDCGSTSGTFLNMNPLSAGKRYEFHDGDSIILGTGNLLARFIFLDNGAD